MIDIDLLLAYGASYKKLAADEIIFREGSSCNFYFQLVEGTVRWVNINEDGKEFIQNIIEEGECFGEMPLFDEGGYAATAMTDSECVILRLHKHTFHQLIREHPEVHIRFSQLLAERLRFKFFILKELAYHDPEQRITALIEYLKKTKKSICPQCSQLKLTRQQIADMTGLRVETVIRAMRSMHEKGSLFINRGKVYCNGEVCANMTGVITGRCSA
ncbi:MAG: Crp/Fnr family transcriptional regulator [Bacteroidota bacterium]|nr:Crp/Fnr family transcriptional regulator [Bacteroidota bacterium]